MMGDMNLLDSDDARVGSSFRVELAKSSRSLCKLCKNKIPKNDIRVSAVEVVSAGNFQVKWVALSL